MKNITSGQWHLNTTTFGGKPVGWEIVGTESGSSNPIIVGMLKADSQSKTISDNYQDARLISAAPDLYEALKNAIESCGDHDPSWIEDAIRAVEKAEYVKPTN